MLYLGYTDEQHKEFNFRSISANLKKKTKLNRAKTLQAEKDKTL